MLPPILDPEELLLRASTQEIVLVDARTGPNAFQQYRQAHLLGAVHIDLERDLAAVPADAAQGGRHPLPAIQQFSALVGKLGISPSGRVVIYDDKGGANAAARFWWMLKAVGHEKAQVLNGGMKAAIAAGFPVNNEEVTPVSSSPYPVTTWQRPMADQKEVAQVATSKEYLVIDVRDAYRYRGEREPIDPVAGHIPGAINVPLTENLQPDGRFLSPAKLAEKYSALLADIDPGNVIVHCGSGVTACHTLLALESAGILGSKLYVGSWSEWCRSDRPIAGSGAPFNELST